MPGSVVLQDELVEILDDYPLTTEMNEALSGKAGKDWVEEELAKYLLLTGGKISGDLEVTGTLYQDGRLRISKGVVSDGDLAAFGAEEGEEGGSGGLDIARLWEELEAEDSSKVIDVSHIPGSVVLQDELTEILDDYPLTTEMNEALAGKAALQHTHAIADVTNLQNALNSKWEWNASQVAGVKVNSAFAADKLASSVKINGTDFNGESDIITARWGSARTITVWDFYNVNKQASQGIDGSANISLKLPQSIKVKTLSIDGVTLSVVGGRLHVDSTLTADGDLVAYGDGDGSSGGGLDEEAMWAALGGSMSSKVISPSHLPSLSSLSGNLDSSRITGLDSALTSYAKKDGSNATGTWPVSISGNAATADISNYLSLNPNDGAQASQNDAVPANGRFAIYYVNTATTSGGNDGYIMAFRWSYGNFVTQVFLDVDATGTMALRHRNSTNVWTDWYRILHSGNIGSYALTPSNYTSTLDSRYVNVYGDTMTGTLNISSSSEALIRYQISGSNKAASGYLASQGAYLYSYPANKYLHITDAGSLLFGSSTVWHSGNDGSGSGLDADLLDGYHESSFLRSRQANNGDFNTLTTSGVYRLYYTTSNGASNGPAGNEWGNMLVLHGGGDTIAQLAFGYVSSDRPMFRQGNPSNVGGAGSWTQWFTLATTLDNVASASKLQTSRTIWGQSFDGTSNVSGEISSCSRIKNASDNHLYLGNSNNSGWVYTQDIASQNGFSYWAIAQTGNAWFKRINVGYSYSTQGSYACNVNGDISATTVRATSVKSYSINIECDDTGALGSYNAEINRTGSTGPLYLQHRGGNLCICANGGNVGIGTTSPAYKLDVSGEIRATSGITIGSTDDIGWYWEQGSRLGAGDQVARGVNVGSLLVSNAWADYTKVPTNGIYCKGDIWTGGRLYIPSSSGNNVFDAYIA